MGMRRNRSLRPGPLAGRHLDDGHGLWRYADRIAVRCHRCATPGWVDSSANRSRFRCVQCSVALDGGCGCARCGPGDWVGPVRYSGRRPCGYCGHQWVSADATRKVASPPVRTLAGTCAQCGRSSDVTVGVMRVRGAEALDPHFGLPLLLVEKTAAGLLWAYNPAHLQALHDYAVAPLRERAGVANGSMFSRLPQWMKLARNRVLLQKATARLMARAR
ncbi:hypothetical protein IEN52_09915 [Stenotrophomonas rhizophila]|nr:hypothetical protein [Stenotrophomonas rhizophila]MCC7663848.1 hypothetical protein [Stenotrophomonas rhizophila]